MMSRTRTLLRQDREGIALLVVLLLTLVIAAIASGAALIGANSFLINAYDQKLSLLEAVADGGLELGRARLNANPGLFPDSGYVTIEAGAQVLDADGRVIPGVTRSVYAGPVGGGPGEYGTFGTLVAIAEDPDGVRSIRRLDLLQSSFAVFAYFTDVEPSEIAFGNNDQLYGPVHSNSNIKIRSTGATFHDVVTTVGIFEGANYAVFKGDTASGVSRILMPTGSQLAKLKTRASPGYLALNGSAAGTASQAAMRIHFLSRTIDGEQVGFLRVYRAPDAGWVTGDVPSGGMMSATNCGHFHGDGIFYSHVGDYSRQLDALRDATRRCYLGGSNEVWGGVFKATDAMGGAWDAFPGPVHSKVAAMSDGSYLFPLDRRYNPGFRGIVHVEGKAVVSGTVRGRVTIAASGNIIVADDIRYATDPGSGSCTDMLGLFSGGQIIIADNMLNAPQIPASGESWYTYDDTRDETIHASLLALDRITVENYGSGSTSAEPCGLQTWGRGCLFVNGGLIQATRGAVSTTSGTGYVKRYTHDRCGVTDPPPYFPSTGHFWRSRYYEVDPTGYDVGAYFRALN